MFFFIPNRRVLLHSQVPSVSTNLSFRGSQKRTFMSLVPKFFSLMKKRILFNCRILSVLKQPVSVCMKSKEVNFANRIYSPLLKAPHVISKKDEILYVLRINQFWRRKLRYMTCVTDSTDKRLLINILNRYRQNFDFTSPYGSTGQTLLKRIILRFKRNIILSGFKYLDTSDFLIKKVFYKREASLSYKINSRTSIFFSLLFSITVLLEISPEPLLNKPDVFFCENLTDVLKYVQDTYVNHICTAHKTPSPCDECSEPINRIVREIFPQTSFDPIEILQKPTTSRLKTITYTLGTILLLITLMDKSGGNHIYEMQEVIHSINYR